jgi:hypothetical protein
MKKSVQALRNLLENVENAGIETREWHIIEDELDHPFITNIALIFNNQFKVAYDSIKKEIVFETTYSNQPITNEYIDHLLEIKEMLPLFQEAMDVISEEKEKEQTA